MPELDHLFICTAPGAPAAELLCASGLTEGSRNRHPGQGTACRRFYFRNAMLELLWLADPAEARLPHNQRLGLAERFRGPASPFGIILRPGPSEPPSAPFASWPYRPPSMPDLIIDVAADTLTTEPLWFCLPAGRRPDEAPPERRQPLEHPAGFKEITRLHLFCPDLPPDSVTRRMANLGLLTLHPSTQHLLAIEFDGAKAKRQIDFRPHLPLLLNF